MKTNKLYNKNNTYVSILHFIFTNNKNKRFSLYNFLLDITFCFDVRSYIDNKIDKTIIK